MTKWQTLDHKSPNIEELAVIEFLRSRVWGQERPIAAVARSYVAWKYGIRNKRKPAGVFFFLGPSGVGKTSLARAVAELIFGDPDALTIIDCSTYRHEHDDSRLLGSPPGYVGDKIKPEFCQEKLDAHAEKKFGSTKRIITEKEIEEMIGPLYRKLMTSNEKIQKIMERANRLDAKLSYGTNLSEEERSKLVEEMARLAVSVLEIRKEAEKDGEKIRQIISGDITPEGTNTKSVLPPVSVLLLDEFEKFHPNITQLFLPAYDSGIMPDAKTGRINFRNCFMFMTSNLASKKMAKEQQGNNKSIGFNTDDAKETKTADDSGKTMYRIGMEEVQKSEHFSTELIGRIGRKNFFVFLKLSDAALEKIVDKNLRGVHKQIEEQVPGITIIFASSLRGYLLNKIKEPEYVTQGARPIEIIVTKEILEPLFSLAIKGKNGGITSGDKIRIRIVEKEGNEKTIEIQIADRTMKPEIKPEVLEETPEPGTGA